MVYSSSESDWRLQWRRPCCLFTSDWLDCDQSWANSSRLYGDRKKAAVCHAEDRSRFTDTRTANDIQQSFNILPLRAYIYSVSGTEAGRSCRIEVSVLYTMELPWNMAFSMFFSRTEYCSIIALRKQLFGFNISDMCSRSIDLSVVDYVWKRVFQHVEHSQRPLLLCTFLYTWNPISEAIYDSFNSILTLSEFRHNVGIEYFMWNPIENFIYVLDHM